MSSTLRSGAMLSIKGFSLTSVGSNPPMALSGARVWETTELELDDGDANVLFADEIEIAQDGSWDLDLGGVRTPEGDVQAINTVREFYVRHMEGAGTVSVAGTFNPFATETAPAISGMVAGDALISARSVPVVDEENDVVTLVANGGTAKVRLVIIGNQTSR